MPLFFFNQIGPSRVALFFEAGRVFGEALDLVDMASLPRLNHFQSHKCRAIRPPSHGSRQIEGTSAWQEFPAARWDHGQSCQSLFRAQTLEPRFACELRVGYTFRACQSACATSAWRAPARRRRRSSGAPVGKVWVIPVSIGFCLIGLCRSYLLAALALHL